MTNGLIKNLRLDANHATFYVFNPHGGDPCESGAVDAVMDSTDEECQRGYVSVETAIAYFIDPDPIEFDLEIYLSDSPPNDPEAKRIFVHNNLLLEEGELAVSDAIGDETVLVSVPPNHYAIYQLTYDYDEESEVAEFALHLVPRSVDSEGEIST